MESKIRHPSSAPIAPVQSRACERSNHGEMMTSQSQKKPLDVNLAPPRETATAERGGEDSVLKQKKGTILTCAGGTYAQPENIRKMLCFMEDGRLFIAKQHAFDPHVSGFKALLSRTKTPFEIIPVSTPLIESLYKNNGGQDDRQENSQNQQSAKDLFVRAVKMRTSDIHIRVNERTGTKILFRIHNDLEFIEEHTYVYGDQFCSTIYQAMTDVSDATFKPNARQDARISNRTKLPEQLDGIRIATSPQVDGYIMVCRLLYNDANESASLKELGFTESQERTIELAKRRPTGINIIAGPTGSGKSTTLQRTLTGIIKETQGRKHIITVEDPPEYPILGAVQTPVTNADTEEERSVQFQLAIKAVMRLDPDIIMIGEMRDKPSVRLALQAAMTGHNVWTTLHANNAIAIIDRLCDLGVPLEVVTDSSIISSLTCQRLLKVLCDDCKIPISQVMERYKESDLRRIMSAVPSMDFVHVKGVGCKHCNHTGITGRTVVAETIITDQKIMTLLRDQKRIEVLDYWRTEQHGISMLEHALIKVEQGLTDPFDAEDVVGPLSMAAIEKDHRIQHSEIQSALGSDPVDELYTSDFNN